MKGDMGYTKIPWYSKFCADSPKLTQRNEQKIYLEERKRLDALENAYCSRQLEFPPPERLHAPGYVAPSSGGNNLSHISPLKRINRNETFDPLRRHSRVILDEMHFRFKTTAGVSDRRNAMENPSHRKNLIQGMLSVTTGGEKPPDPHLKEGKKLPVYLKSGKYDYSQPEHCNVPLDDPDDYYNNETYIVTNKQGTIFRFSKSKSLFLFDQNSKIRSAVVNLFITPLFAHFITFIILCNCACLVLVEPPKWIDDYLEYVFTAIYLAEASVKIIARGFVLHRFSYLRDPWNWLDFIVIVSAIITAVLKALISEGTFTKVAVLRAFRVLRALKTMSIVPGLRAIVKALLRSIKALKDAVLLTAFCVSVFGLIGYQLFHGNLRQKCVLISGTLDIPPDSMFLYQSNRTDLHLHEFRTNSSMLKDVDLIGRSWATGDNDSQILIPLYSAARKKHDFHCANKNRLPEQDSRMWSKADTNAMKIIINKTECALNIINNSSINEESESFSVQSCLVTEIFRIRISALSSLLQVANRIERTENEGSKDFIGFDPGGWNCSSLHASNNESAFLSTCDAFVTLHAANISCLENNSNTTSLNRSMSSAWGRLMTFGKRNIPRWATRQLLILFRLTPSIRRNDVSFQSMASFVYFTEMSMDSVTQRGLFNSWLHEEDNHCKAEPATGLFFHVGSSNRPPPEPLYCSKEANNCPLGYECLEAGSNPDFGYTSFDNFFVAFLTSFRLVALDAWSRLYYLTLHTAGPGYAIFYMVVVFLGSYYLVNLILAVVYMAYEEQQAAVDEEEDEAKAREEEERELEREIDHSSDSCTEEDHTQSDESGTSSAQEKGRMGLITTSLGPPSIGGVSRGSVSHKRRKLRHRGHSSGAKSSSVDVENPFSDDEEEEGRRDLHHRFQRSCTNRVRRANSDVVKEANQRFSFRHKRASSVRHKRTENGKFGNKLERKLSTPLIQLVVTEPTPTSPPTSSKEFVVNTSASGNHLAVNTRVTSESTETGVEKTSTLPIVLSTRKASEASTISDENAAEFPRVVQVDVNRETKHDPIQADHSMQLFSPDTQISDSTSTNSFHSSVFVPPTSNSGKQNHRLSCNGSGKLTNGNGEIATIRKNMSSSTLSEETLKSLPLEKSPLEEFPLIVDDCGLKSNAVYVTALGEDEIQIKVPNMKTISNPDDSEKPLIHRDHHHHHSQRRRKKAAHKSFSTIFVNNFAKWECIPESITKKVRDLVLNPFADVIITLCIALNAMFMTIEHHPMQPGFTRMLDHANVFFTVVFTVEMITKIVGLSPHTYFRQRWNVFDAVVVLFSLLEIVIKSTGGFTILRAFRLMRIVKLAKQWPTLNKLLRIIGRTLGKLWHLTLVFLLVLYIFAVVGMQLLHKDYKERYQDNLPRWNFCDFSHAFMVVFRIQCGEWVENMFVCINVARPEVCIPFFIIIYFIGNLVILNLFLALLLNSFSGDVLQQTASESNSISEVAKRIKAWAGEQRKRLKCFARNLFCCRALKRNSKRSTCGIRSPDEIQTPDTEFTVITIDKRSDGNDMQLSPNGNNILPIIEDKESIDDNMEEHQDVTCKRHSDIFLNIENGHFKSNSMESCRKTSLHYEATGTNSHSLQSISDCSLHSSSSHRGRRRRRTSRSTASRARDRYRGISSNSDQARRDHSDASTSQERRMDDSSQASNIDVVNKSGTEGNEDEPNKKSIEPCLSCFPNSIFERGSFFKLRQQVYKIVEHRYFDFLVIFGIILSSITLAMDDIYLSSNPPMERALKYIDIFCCVFFTIEMVLKWIGYGWKSYFSNPWCLLDCAIVLISIINLSMTSSGQGNLSAFRALRTFRALRPLRALSRFKGMKVVVDALIRAIPPILHVFFVCMVFWLIFGILGVNIFGGRFGRCVALSTGDILPMRVRYNETEGFRQNLPPTTKSLEEQCSVNNTMLMKYLHNEIDLNVSAKNVLPAVRDKNECELCAKMLNSSNIHWQVPSVNFDSVPKAYLALMQVATFNGWLEIMESAVDITGIEMQPHYEVSFYYYIYFCVFIIFGAFFSLNLFIGVIIDNFNQQKIKQKGGDDGVFLTEEQRQYYNAMKKMASRTPSKPIPRPENPFSNKIYDIVCDRKFEIGIMALILANLVVMAIEHYDMPPEMNDVLQKLNFAFICIFLLEAILKLIGLRFYYFRVPWNVFDMLVVVVSLVVNISTATGLNDVMSQYFVQPTIFRIVRLFRVTRILRLIREAKGIRTLLFALMMSLPALFNIGSLLVLLMCIYAIIGMSQFPYVQHIAGVDDILNFETFPSAFLLLFQVSTSEGWDRFIEPLLREKPPYCDEKPSDGSPNNCGNSTIGVLYFVTYVMTTFLIVVNMYIAVILENFEVATRENAEPLTADDFEQFFEVWQRYDDRLTQFVRYDQLKRLLNDLDYPLQVVHPNTAFISHSHMRITVDGRIHCLEVIIALIKKVLGDSPQLKNLKEAMLESFMLKCKTKEQLAEATETIDSEEFIRRIRAIIIIQRAFRKHLAMKKKQYKKHRTKYQANSNGDGSKNFFRRKRSKVRLSKDSSEFGDGSGSSSSYINSRNSTDNETTHFMAAAKEASLYKQGMKSTQKEDPG